MSNLKLPIKVDQLGIGQILKQFKLRVPPHQRDYSWTSDRHVVTLFQDLAKAIANNDQSYFLGTIVTIPDSSGRLELIDGQQRLATITILLHEMRRYLLDKDPLIAEDIKSFLTYTERDKRAILPRMSLNLADNEFFIAMLAEDSGRQRPQPRIKSHRLICDAIRTAADYVGGLVARYNIADHGDILNKWIGFIETNADVILLQIPSGAHAYKMFETLNDRGLKTTQADLVKNFLFSQAGDARLAEAQTIWASMRGALELIQAEEDEDKEDITVTFLRHALIAVQGFLRKNEVFEAVQRSGKGAQASIAFLKEVENLAGVYVSTFFRDHERWNPYPDAIRHAIWTLNFLDIHPFRPVLLSVAAKFPPKESLKAFELFISLGVRLIIASSTRSGVIEETLAKAANKIFTGRITNLAGLKAELAGIIPSDEQFRQAFEIVTVSRGPQARYYLRTLENVAKKQPTPYFKLADEKEVISLEHVLPQKPEGNWPQFTAEQAETCYKRLGNMVLLQSKSNNDLKNADWRTKCLAYKNHPYC
jgi:hypothetical protein